LEPLGKIWAMKALIANNNMIKSMAGLEALKKINTLVLSHNQIATIEGIATLKEVPLPLVPHPATLHAQGWQTRVRV